jgi:hypothetical protein
MDGHTRKSLLKHLRTVANILGEASPDEIREIVDEELREQLPADDLPLFQVVRTAIVCTMLFAAKEVLDNPAAFKPKHP